MLVTHDGTDFRSLMERARSHPGLICMNVAHGLMGLDVQQGLFKHARTQLADAELVGQVVEITFAADQTVRVDGHLSRSA